MRLPLFLLAAAPLFAQSGVIAVYSNPASVPIGTTRQFTTYVSVSPNTIVWSINNIPGGNATYGTINSSGLYTAPAMVPMDNVITLKATSTAYPSIYGTSTVTITKPQPWVWSVYPSTIPAGAYSIRLNGAGFTPETYVTLAGQKLPTTYVSATDVRATGVVQASQAGAQLAVRAVNPDPGGLTSSAVTIAVGQPVVTVGVSPTTATLNLGASQQFNATVTGTTNTGVTWTASAGAITATGLYTAPGNMPGSNTVTIRATSAANTTISATAVVTLQSNAPPPPPVNVSNARFLEQAAFGPDSASLAKVAQLGMNGWLDEQFALPETAILVPAGTGQARADYLYRLAHANDQLRQRMIHALSNIIVVSFNKNIYPNEVVPHYQALSRNAFGNYRTLLGEVTRSPQMGKYLDLANSNKPGLGSGANENFARELLQLFTIGLYQLNPDGSQQLDGNNQPILTYNQATIQQTALALTGWTYPTAPGSTAQPNNWENFSGPMEARQGNHDVTAKSLLGCNLPANQTVQQDTDAVLDCAFNHPNMPPFFATRLIRAIVKSNPSPAYIQRVGAVFANNGSGVRGDLKATLRAVIMDTEARQDTATPNEGRLKDPMYYFASFVRVMNGQISQTNGLAYMFDNMSQNPMTPPSVFGFYTPGYRIPRTPLFGPEFQIYSATDSVVRGNILYQLLTNQLGSDMTVDLTPFQSAAGNITQLIDVADTKLLYGRMPAAMRQSLATALAAAYDNNQRVQTVVYLTVLSGQYAVQY